MRSHSLLAIAVTVLAFGTPGRASADDLPAPPQGYHYEAATNWPLVGGGIGAIALSGLTFFGAARANAGSARTDNQEVLGPFLTLTGIVLAAGGVGLVLVGVAHPQNRLVPDAAAAHFVLPVVARDRIGLAAGVVF